MTTQLPSLKILKYFFAALVFFIGGFFVSIQLNSAPAEAASGRLICMPVDENGNITNDKYSYDRMLVKNETNEDIQIVLQTNLCDYQEGAVKEGYECNEFEERLPYPIKAGEAKIIPSSQTTDIRHHIAPNWVSCMKTGQLDIFVDDDHYRSIGVDPNTIPDCYNTVDNREWEGGIAYTIKENPNPNCCPDLNIAVDPDSPQVGSNVTIKATSPYSLVCTGESYTGLNNVPANRLERTADLRTWIWEDVPVGNTPGLRTFTFKGNTKDSGVGECDARAIGDWCEVTAEFFVEEPSSPQCNNISFFADGAQLSATQLGQIRPGQEVKLKCGSTGFKQETDRYEYRLFKGSTEIPLESDAADPTYSEPYTITADGAGSYFAQCRTCRSLECEPWEPLK